MNTTKEQTRVPPAPDVGGVTGSRVGSSDLLGSVFIISWDREPQPWEDWSYPFRVIVGTEEQARAHAGKLQEEKGGLFSVQQVNGEGTPILILPNDRDDPRGNNA